jgi:hypothetical protein
MRKMQILLKNLQNFVFTISPLKTLRYNMLKKHISQKNTEIWGNR